MVYAVAAVAGLVAVCHALVTKRMVGLMLRLTVAGAVGIGVRCVNAHLTLIVDDATTRIACAIFALPPTAHQLA